MKEISATEKKQILLRILIEIDSFCRKNNITYFLTGGTLLGAIRHNGFIPWDDDIDICLLRKDYELLIQNFHSETGYVTILSRKNKRHYYWPFAKAIDSRTILIESRNKKSAIGVYVDIFPLDDVSGDKITAKRYIKRVWFWRNLLTLKHLAFSKKRTLFKNIFILMGRILYIIPDAVFLKRIEHLSVRKTKKNDCFYVCNFAGAWKYKELAEKSIFSVSINHSFEDHLFTIPREYDKYLRGVYGNYMVLPPVEKRVSHHDSIAFWKEKK